MIRYLSLFVSNMSELKSIDKACGCEKPAQFDFVFLHGLTGDAHDTWSYVNGSSKVFWPSWLCEDFPESAVYTLGYSASIFQKWAKQELNLHERAEVILEDLASHDIGKRPLAFITHSLGGLLAKEVLRVTKECQDDDWKSVGQNTRLMCFLGTPHTGAALADVVKAFVPRLSSTHVSVLSNDSGYLTSLNKAYRDIVGQLGISTVAYYEKHKTKAVALVVSPESADPGVANCRPIAIEADHIGICKLKSREDLVYRSLRRHVAKIVERGSTTADATPGVFGPADYSTASESDRRDLLQKLIDAGREHEYPHANDLQNRFARDYYRLGLHTEAKQKSDAILSEVEQRFITHVYHEKICKNASDDEIRMALQTHVIDATCGKSGSGVVAPGSVLQALYFLTEGCHIRWDKP